MSGEIRLQATAELTVKALIVGEDGKVWNGSAMVVADTLTDAEWTATLIACTEQDTSDATGTGLYIANWPGALTQAAVYSVQFFSGANPAPGSLSIGAQQDATEYLSSQLDGVIADLPIKATKNVALANFGFIMVLTSDHITGATGKTVTCQRSIDGAAFANSTNTPATEVANGSYKITLSAADMNGDVIMLKFTAADSDTTFIEILTQPT